MMNIFSHYPLYLLIVSNAALIFAAAIAVLRFERMIRRNRAFWESPAGAATQAAGNADAVLPAFLERRLALLHEQILKLGKQLDSQKAPAAIAQSVELPFQHAARMAKQGASVADLTRTCGLKKAEAQLMRRLHTHATTAASTH